MSSLPGLEAATWHFLEPKQLPEMRGKLASWLRDQGADFYYRMLLIGSQQIYPPMPLRDAAAWLASREFRQVFDADLYWATPEMTALARHIGGQLQNGEIYAHDLPSQAGFMVFAEPIGTWSETGQMTEIVAASWSVIPSQTQLMHMAGGIDVPIVMNGDQGSVWFTFYSDPHGFVRRNLPSNEEAAAYSHRPVGPFLPDNELIWSIGICHDLPEGNETTCAWGQIVCAAWLLMRQRLACRSEERAPRPARRRLQRAKLPDDDVQLIHIRRPERAPGESASGTDGRTHDHRWLVTGHVRRYHCGKGRGRVERRWISPYLAGPDDKPIRLTERVKVWDR